MSCSQRPEQHGNCTCSTILSSGTEAALTIRPRKHIFIQKKEKYIGKKDVTLLSLLEASGMSSKSSTIDSIPTAQAARVRSLILNRGELKQSAQTARQGRRISN